jgi:hypothetical protein
MGPPDRIATDGQPALSDRVAASSNVTDTDNDPVSEAPPATIALIDLASVCPSGDEQRHADALDLISLMVRGWCGAVPGHSSAVHEVECRLYGGFRDVVGNPTPRRLWLVKHLERLRGLTGGIRLVPGIAESIASAPEVVLIGTYANGAQKMVDGMIAEDAGLFARSGMHRSILLISDDEDFMPTVLAISRTTRATFRWLRQRPVGRNDVFFNCSVQLLTDGRWR